MAAEDSSLIGTFIFQKNGGLCLHSYKSYKTSNHVYENKGDSYEQDSTRQIQMFSIQNIFTLSSFSLHSGLGANFLPV